MNDVWSDRLKALALVIAALGSVLATCLSAINHDKVSKVENQVTEVQAHQQVNTTKLDEAKTAADVAKQEALNTKKVVVETKKAVEETKKAVMDNP